MTAHKISVNMQQKQYSLIVTKSMNKLTLHNTFNTGKSWTPNNCLKPEPETITEQNDLKPAQKSLLQKTANIVERAHKTKANDEAFKLKAMEAASKTMSEYLREKENLAQPFILHHITTLCGSKEATPKKHAFKFQNTRDAAKFNTKLIKHTDYDFVKCLGKQKNSMLSAGSEFRAIDHIKNLLQYHEDWPEIRQIIEEGCNYQLEADSDEETRLSDLKAMIARGNHKSAKVHHAILDKAFTKEILKGWLLPITVESLTKIKNLSIIPLGIAEQFTIDEEGNRIPKRRVTHDASFPAPSGISVNNKVIEALLQDCIYGQCLRRILHGIHEMRYKNPTKRIFMTKYDMDAAYRRLHSMPIHALKCVTVIGKLAYIPLRLPFGVSPGPSLYSTISECIYDVVNDLLNEKQWNRKILNSPQVSLLQKPEPPDTSIGLEEAHKLAVYIPERNSFADGYIDDCLSVALDEDDEIQRSQEAPPLVVHAIFRPLDAADPLPRDENISIKKLKGEGQPSEKKVMLGWLIDTVTMRVYLPIDKAIDWSREIRIILEKNSVTMKELEKTIGRLNHTGYIIPVGRYFLNRLRHLLQRCEKYGKQHLQRWEKEDLVLWQKFLSNASQNGVSINNITYTEINSYIITDACEYGIGGYNLRTGAAWRLKLPNWMTTACHINLLEFIASVIGIWLEIINDESTKYKRFRALTDNSSAVGWLYKSNFNPKTHPGHDTVARTLAEILMESESSIESQHIKGSHNVVADSLSRDHHIESTHLEFILKTLFPSQAQKSFKICRTLPKEIISWLDSLKGIMTTSGVLPPKPGKSKVGTLYDGKNSLKSVTSMTNSLIHSMNEKRSPSCRLSRQVLEEMRMVEETKDDLRETQYHPPSITYARPFGRTFGGTRL